MYRAGEVSPELKNQTSFKIILARIGLVLISLLGSVTAAQWVCEKYFFDKLYYNKSVAHGYWIPGKKIRMRDFGHRAEDLQRLRGHKAQRPCDRKVSSGQTAFTVAVIGDSDVWGQGLLERDRFANLLEKKLSVSYPTCVLSLANSGDSILENYLKYRIIQRLKWHVDFYVFGLVDNDFLFLPSADRYDASLQKQILSQCKPPFLFAPVFDPSNPGRQVNLHQLFVDALRNDYGNLCVAKKIAAQLPRNNTVYINFANDEYSILLTYESILRENGLKVISPRAMPSIFQKYAKYKPRDFSVSAMEEHPSALANRMFADMLYEEISSSNVFKARLPHKPA